MTKSSGSVGLVTTVREGSRVDGSLEVFLSPVECVSVFDFAVLSPID